MQRSIGPWRAVRQRSRAEWPVVVAAFLLLLCATTLLASGVLYADTVTRGGLREALRAGSGAERSVLVRGSVPSARLPEVDAQVHATLANALGPAGGEVSLVLRSVTSAPAGTTPAGTSGDLRQLVAVRSYDDLATHARLTAGRWARAGASPTEATMPEAAATALGVRVGEVFTVDSPIAGGAPLSMDLVGTWEPGAADPFWGADPLELAGTVSDDSSVTRGPIVVPREDLVAALPGASLDAQWRALPVTDRLDPDALAPLQAGIAGIGPALRLALPGGPSFAIDTAMPARLDAVARSVLVTRGGILLLVLQFALLAGYAVLLVAGMLAERRRPEIALLRSRGAGSMHLAGLAAIEALMLAIPAAALAPFLALGVVTALGRIGPLAEAGIVDPIVLTADVVLASIAAAAVYLVALVLPAIATGISAGPIRSAFGRPLGRTLPQRLGLDLALVAVAAVAIWQLRLYGAPLTRNGQGALGVDVLLVAAPAIGLLAGAVVATRLVPRVGEVAERFFERGPALVLPLGARQVARRPLRYTRAALLLMLAASLGTFAAAQAATWSRSQVDQAAYAAAADLRVVPGDYPRLPTWAIGSSYRAVPGVDTASPIVRQDLTVGQAVPAGTLLAVDGPTVASIATFPAGAGGAARTALGSLAAPPTELRALTLPGHPVAIEVGLDSAMTADPSSVDPSITPGEIASYGGVEVTLVLLDADGVFHRVQADAGALGGSGQRLEARLSRTITPAVTARGATAPPTDVTVTAAVPLRLVAVEVALLAPPMPFGYGAWIPVNGTVDLTSIAVRDADGSTVSVPIAPASTGWTWSQAGGGPAAPYSPPAGMPLRIEASAGDPAAGPIFRLGAGAPSNAVLPAIAGDAFMAATGARVGDEVVADSLGQPIRLHIVATAATFPTLDPASPFVIVDLPAFEAARYGALDQVGGPTEWWLAVEPGHGPAVAAALTGEPYRPASVVERSTLQHSLASDPVALGIIGALALGALAALAFAAIGFVVSTAISATERLGEFALLRALGLSSRDLSTWLTLEQAFLLAFGLIVGTALGALLAWLVLPFTTLTQTGAAAVPSPVVVIPWAAILPFAVVALLVLLVSVWLAVRQLPGVRVSGVLRAWEG